MNSLKNMIGLKPFDLKKTKKRPMKILVCLHCVTVCCSVLQCVAVCCSVLQCVAVCCSVLQCVAVCIRQGPRKHQCIAVCCNVLQCVVLVAVSPRVQCA